MLVIGVLCQISVGRTICQILISRTVNYRKQADSQLAIDNACQIKWEGGIEAISKPLNLEGGYDFWACFVIGVEEYVAAEDILLLYLIMQKP